MLKIEESKKEKQEENKPWFKKKEDKPWFKKNEGKPYYKKSFNKGEESNKKPDEGKGNFGGSKTIAKEGAQEGTSATVNTAIVEATLKNFDSINLKELTE